jgi:hypothetical protein
MMGGMMGFGWLVAALILALIVAGFVWGVSVLTKGEGTPAKTGLTILAVVAGVAIVALLGVSFMHFGMMGCC